MTSDNIGIVYGTLSGIIRRVIVPDDDAELSGGAHSVGNGETLLVVAKSDAPTMADIPAAVERATGKPPPSGRVAVVDKSGVVTAVICADPLIDVIAGATLVAHDEAVVGWTMVGKSLASPSAVDVTPALDVPADAVISE